MKEKILKELFEAQEMLTDFIGTPEQIHNIEKAAQLMITSLKAGGKLIICGNGGSMSDAMHFASELTGKYREERQAIPAIAISDPSFITCVANDFGYDQVFKRGFQALATHPHDILVCISTSGNSPNVLVAAEYAKMKGYSVVGLIGNHGGKLKQYCDIDIQTPPITRFADRHQEIDIKIIHILCLLIEDGLGYGKQ
jgi:D-sedoheptulose 7-phosphate isomerase